MHASPLINASWMLTITLDNCRVSGIFRKKEEMLSRILLKLSFLVAILDP